MTPELDKKLCDKYPKIFQDRNADASVTAMCWGFPGDGWYTLIDKLCAVIQGHCVSKDTNYRWCVDNNAMIETARAGDWTIFEERYKDYTPALREHYRQEIINGNRKLLDVSPEPCQVIASQVKEKFGGLRFYVNDGDDYVFGAIALAEGLSHTICEECGMPGMTRGPGWIRTLCSKHATEYKKHSDDQVTRLNTIRLHEVTSKELDGAECDGDGVITQAAIDKILANRQAKE